jgi:hypothetical protein
VAPLERFYPPVGELALEPQLVERVAQLLHIFDLDVVGGRKTGFIKR